MTEEGKLESAIHHHLIRGLIDNGFAPDIARLQELVAAEPVSTVLPFRSEADVDAWCLRHAIAKGAVAPIGQVAELARVWYGKHADHDWKKWSIAQARQIFERVGLTGPFWALETDAGGQTF